jgi:hypothetical protein
MQGDSTGARTVFVEGRKERIHLEGKNAIGSHRPNMSTKVLPNN